MKKNIYLNVFLFLTFAISLSSCVNQKKFVYFQNTRNESDTINTIAPYVPKIQQGDILSIPITSLNAAASSFFNPYSSSVSANPTDLGSTSPMGNATPNTSSNSPSGYLVDQNGMIEIPLLGSIKLEGLTTSEARDVIKNKLKTYIKEPSVNVRFLNYKISVMGEVAKPSVYFIPNERVTIAEALAMAGDVTVYAKRENVLIVRDNNGKKEFGRVNLNSRDVFVSPYYYLHSGDLVYVEQGRSKAAQSDPTIRLLPVILSTIAAAFLIIYRSK
ncbi:MAG: polysaccharide biosynthesis/export family protein [Bacteroidota bacterium]